MLVHLFSTARTSLKVRRARTHPTQPFSVRVVGGFAPATKDRLWSDEVAALTGIRATARPR